MATLDTRSDAPKGTEIWNTVLKYGGYCGGAFIFFSLLTYLADMDVMSISGGIMMFMMLLGVGFTVGALAMKYQRDQLDGGFISYGKALAVGFLVVLIGMIISSLWSFVFVNYIAPDYLVAMKEQFVENWGSKMPEEAMEETMANIDKSGEFIGGLYNGLKGGVFYGLVVGLITAAFMKRENKPGYMN